MAEPTYSSSEACELVGLTMRKLDSWTREWGILSPSTGPATPGSGTYRRWSEADLRALRVLRRLSDLHATRGALTSAARLLRRDPPRARDARWLHVTESSARYRTLRELPSAGDGWIVRLGD